MELAPAFGEREQKFFTPTEARDALIRHWGAEPSSVVHSFHVADHEVEVVTGVAIEAARRLVDALAKGDLRSLVFKEGELGKLKRSYWNKQCDYFIGTKVLRSIDGHDSTEEPTALLWSEDQTGSSGPAAGVGVGLHILIPETEAREWIAARVRAAGCGAAQPPKGGRSKADWYDYLVQEFDLAKEAWDAEKAGGKTKPCFPSAKEFCIRVDKRRFPNGKLPPVRSQRRLEQSQRIFAFSKLPTRCRCKSESGNQSANLTLFPLNTVPTSEV